MSNRRNKHIYVIRNKENGRIKIGITEDIKTRLSTLQNQCGCYLDLLYFSPATSEAERIEKELHQYFAKYHYLGEWFNMDYNLVIDRITFKYAHLIRASRIKDKVSKMSTLTKEIMLSKDVLTARMKRVGKCLYKDKDGTIYEVFYKNGVWNIEEVTNVGTE